MNICVFGKILGVQLFDIEDINKKMQQTFKADTIIRLLFFFTVLLLHNPLLWYLLLLNPLLLSITTGPQNHPTLYSNFSIHLFIHGVYLIYYLLFIGKCRSI
ncbi:hypothetical protein EUGRSUZ_F01997 [Eucalyptus grandis]|uniref:Uncharacterized protein n=2 Tax=Eucalyptus grandis TaxID=71139 RepID=A0A059BQL6_EUCGR|nr:hypothetical protein EUGRSUZ_F01997 [Eucalyptus grandis]